MNTLKSILIAVVVYIVAGELLDAFILGTTTGDILITTLVPIGLAVATVWVAMKSMSD